MLRKFGVGIILSSLFVSSIMAHDIQFSTQRIIDMQTQEIKGNTLVPAKHTAEMMDLSFKWDEEKQSIEIMDMGNVLTLYVGKAKGLFNHREIQLSVAPIQIEGTLYIPLRVVAEQFGYKMIGTKDRIVLARSLSEADIEMMRSWQIGYHQYGFLYALCTKDQEDMPYKEAQESIKPQIAKIKADITSDKSSKMVKVLGQEYISILEDAELAYNIDANNKEALETAFYGYRYKEDYIENECKMMKANWYPKESYERNEEGMVNPAYDELRVSIGYTALINRLTHELEDANKQFVTREIYMEEIIYRIGSTANIRENLKYIKQKTRSSDAQQVMDSYIAYSDCVITYYCAMKDNLHHPKGIDSQYQKAVIEAKNNMEKAYEAYQSFGE